MIPRALLWVAALVAAASVIAASDVAAGSWLRLLVVLLLGAVPGWLLYRAAVQPGSRLEELLGSLATALACWALSGWWAAVAGLPALRLLPFAALLLLAVPAVRSRLVRPVAATPLPLLGGAVLGVVGSLLLVVRPTVRDFPVQWDGWAVLWPDLPFHIGLTGEAALRSSPVYPFDPTQELAYHWLYHAAMGWWVALSGVPATAVVMHASFLLVGVLIPIGLAVVAWEVARRPVAPLAVAVLALALRTPDPLGSGYLKAFYPGHLYWTSPTTDLSVAVSTVVLLLAVRLWRGELPGRAPLALLGLVLLAAVGMKGSAAAVILGGMALPAAQQLLQARRGAAPVGWRTRVWLLPAMTVAAALVVTTLLVRAGEAGSPGLLLQPGALAGYFEPLIALVGDRSVLLVGALVVASYGVTWLATVSLWGCPGVRAGDPAITVLVGGGLAGLAGIYLFGHLGGSQEYFLRSAVPWLLVGVAWALAAWVDAVGWPTVVVGTALVAAATWAANGPGQAGPEHPLRAALWPVATAIVVASVVAVRQRPASGRAGLLLGAAFVLALLPATSSLADYRQVSAVGGTPAATGLPGPDSKSSWHGDQARAAVWLSGVAGVDDLIATNRHCRNPDATVYDQCDARAFLLSAWAQRRVLVEGWSYSPQYFDELDPYLDPDRLAAGDEFIRRPTAGGAALLRQYGVDWLFVDLREPHADDFGDLATEVYRSDWAVVYRMADG